MEIQKTLIKQGKYGEALNYYFQSKKMKEDLGLGRTADNAITLNNIGLVYDSQGKYEEALDYYSQSRKINKDLGLGKTAVYAGTLNNIGLVYGSLEKYEEALNYYFQSKKIKEDLGLGKTGGYGATLNNIGLAYGSLEKYEEALNYYFQSKKIKEDLGLGKTRDNASTLNNIGLVYYGKGEYCKSMEWFQKAVAIEEQNEGIIRRDNLNAAQEKCDLSKPTNVEQEKKKAIDWIIKNNRWGTKDNTAVQLLTDRINTAIQDKKKIYVAFGSGIMKSTKAIVLYWKNNRFSVQELSDEEVNKIGLGEMHIRDGELND
jgi:tetratricopeptide (TPR) repeat protein